MKLSKKIITIITLSSILIGNLGSSAQAASVRRNMQYDYFISSSDKLLDNNSFKSMCFFVFNGIQLDSEPEPEPKPIPLSQQIADLAQIYLGVPYVWGGTSPEGFDCSGLCQYIYKQKGIIISRTTYTQINEGTPISMDQLQPGDLVFFGNAQAPYHVGIYIGRDRFIHAPTQGDVVKISILTDRSDYSAARRIVN